jgi:hypothetical protein
MTGMLYRVLVWIIALNIFSLGVLIAFLINARINLKRDIKQKARFYKFITLARTAKSSETAAQQVGISVEEFTLFCEHNGIETPEHREARIKKEQDQEEAERQRILAEEAAWRSEQERILEERRQAQEEESRTRKERLRKFGFR